MYQYFIQGWIRASSLGESAPQHHIQPSLFMFSDWSKYQRGTQSNIFFSPPWPFARAAQFKAALQKILSNSPRCNSFRPTASMTTVWRPNFPATYFLEFFSTERRQPDQYAHDILLWMHRWAEKRRRSLGVRKNRKLCSTRAININILRGGCVLVR